MSTTRAAGEVQACVFAPGLLLTVTVEGDPQEARPAEVHLHAGGQGLWLSRMLQRLGHRVVLATALGGEPGAVVAGLVADEDVELAAVRVAEPTAAYVHDRREGERDEIVRTPEPALSRHERDDLYGLTLQHAVAAGVCVVTGRPPGSTIDVDFYRRLGADLSNLGVRTVGDLHGEELDAFLDEGRLDVLKASDEDLVADGRLEEGGDLGSAAAKLSLADVGLVVVSSADRPTMARAGDRWLEADSPRLHAADHRGSGDSMTAALVAAVIRDLDHADALRLACAAGAANVTRHGLATADPGLIDELARRVEVREVGGADADGGEGEGHG